MDSEKVDDFFVGELSKMFGRDIRVTKTVLDDPENWSTDPGLIMDDRRIKVRPGWRYIVEELYNLHALYIATEIYMLDNNNARPLLPEQQTKFLSWLDELGITVTSDIKEQVIDRFFNISPGCIKYGIGE